MRRRHIFLLLPLWAISGLSQKTFLPPPAESAATLYFYDIYGGPMPRTLPLKCNKRKIAGIRHKRYTVVSVTAGEYKFDCYSANIKLQVEAKKTYYFSCQFPSHAFAAPHIRQVTRDQAEMDMQQLQPIETDRGEQIADCPR